MKNAVDMREERGGFVLIAVLSVMALLSGLTVIMLMSSANSVGTADIASRGLKMEGLVQSGLSIAAYQLFILKTPPERLVNQQVRVDQGVVAMTVTTDAGKADLNASNLTLLAAAYQASGLKTLTAQSFAARVVDWRDADETVGDDGAENAEYRAIGLAYGPANRPFRSIGDLRWVAGVSPADIRVLSDFVTVYNPRGRLDVFSAPQTVIAALPGVDAETVAQVVATRQTRNGASTARLADLLLVQAALIDGELPKTYHVALQATIDGQPRRIDVVMTSGVAAGAAYHILHWTE